MSRSDVLQHIIQEVLSMKKVALLTLMILALGAFAMAQITTVSTDVLGAHLNYGRGCAGCHAPHSGARGNGATTSDTLTGDVALWGQDVSNLIGKTIKTGQFDFGQSFSETLPALGVNAAPDALGVTACLSCHDGNWAQGAMMKNTVFETVPSTYSSNNIPTLLGHDGNALGDYLNDHPVGVNATIACGGAYNWDCTIDATGNIVPGPKMGQFINNYGWFVAPAAVNAKPAVMCTTCHNQHVMNVVNVTYGANGLGGYGSALPTGSYATMFFVRGPYNPNDTNAGGNQTAQFCRSCHGGESNEMNGSTAGTIF
jgi:nitrate/TMAO reductase-like tetraheme cytochrome c subunit